MPFCTRLLIMHWLLALQFISEQWYNSFSIRRDFVLALTKNLLCSCHDYQIHCLLKPRYDTRMRLWDLCRNSKLPKTFKLEVDQFISDLCLNSFPVRLSEFFSLSHFKLAMSHFKRYTELFDETVSCTQLTDTKSFSL